MSKLPQSRKKGTRNAKTTYNKVGRHGAIPHTIYQHENYKALTAHGRMLLIDVLMQYNGSNNGDMCITWSVMRGYGWKSRHTLEAAKAELLHYGFIEQTRHGGLGICSLFALSWYPINDCNRKHHVKPTDKPSGLYRRDVKHWQHSEWNNNRRKLKKKPDTTTVSSLRVKAQ